MKLEVIESVRPRALPTFLLSKALQPNISPAFLVWPPYVISAVRSVYFAQTSRLDSVHISTLNLSEPKSDSRMLDEDR